MPRNTVTSDRRDWGYFASYSPTLRLRYRLEPVAQAESRALALAHAGKVPGEEVGIEFQPLDRWLADSQAIGDRADEVIE